jgi:hypothetical protein
MAETVLTKVTATYRAVPLPVDDSLADEFTYDGDGNIETITREYYGILEATGAVVEDILYTQTFTYDVDGNVTGISQWEPPA